MSNKYFGQYLLENTFVTAAQLRDALVHQRLATSKRLGARATSAGFLSSEDAERISSLVQSEAASFADIAARESLLSSDRIESLVSSDIDEQVSLGEALLEIGAFEKGELEGYLQAYGENVYSAPPDLQEIFRKSPEPDLLIAVTNQYMQGFAEMLHMAVSVDSCYSDIGKVPPCNYTFYQTFKGDFEGQVQLNLSSGHVLLCGSKLLGEEPFTVDKQMIDGTCEFLNIMNGNICARLSKLGKSVQVEAPRYHTHPEWGERSGQAFDLAGMVGSGQLTVVPLHCQGDDEPVLCIIQSASA